MNVQKATFFILLALTAVSAGCGGGNSVSSVPVSLPASSQSTIIAGSTAQTASFAPIASGYSGALMVPAVTAGSGATITAQLLAGAPPGAPTLQSAHQSRSAQAAGGTATILAYCTLTVSATITFPMTFSLILKNVGLANGTNDYLSVFDTTAGDPSEFVFNYDEGPETVQANALTFPALPQTLTLVGGDTYYLILFSVDQIAGPAPSPSAAASATASPSNAATAAATVTPAATPTPTAMPTPAATATPTSAATSTPTPSASPSYTPFPTPSPTPPATPTPTPASTTGANIGIVQHRRENQP